jgi:signal transduction protein with GAF and PtsI domain
VLFQIQATLEAKLEMVFDLLNAENQLLKEKQDEQEAEIRRLKADVGRLTDQIRRLSQRLATNVGTTAQRDLSQG